MSNSSTQLNFVHFTDDTTVFISSPNFDELYYTINSELRKIDEWLMLNRLLLIKYQ